MNKNLVFISCLAICAVGALPSAAGTEFVWQDGQDTGGQLDGLFILPDSHYATFTGNGRFVFIANKTGGVFHDLQGNSQRVLVLNGGDCDRCSAHISPSPDGKYVAYFNGAVRLADAQTGNTVLQFESERGMQLTTYNDAPAFSPDGKYLALSQCVENSDTDCKAGLWDVATGKPARMLGKLDSYYGKMTFSPDGKYLLVTASNQRPVLWEIGSGSKLHTFKYKDHASGGFSADGKNVFIVHDVNQLEIWDIASEKTVGEHDGKGEGGCAVNVWAVKSWEDPVGGNNNYCGYLLVIPPTPAARAKAAKDDFLEQTMGGYSKSGHDMKGEVVSALAISPDGRYLVSASGWGYDTLRLWEWADKDKDLAGGWSRGYCDRYTYKGFACPDVPEAHCTKLKVRGLEFSADGKHILVWDSNLQYHVLLARTSFTDMLKRLMAPGNPPDLPGKLVQGKYESKAAFAARVEKTKSDYAAEVARYNAGLTASPSAEVLAKAFVYTYGNPVVSAASYDADSEVFTFTVKSDGSLPSDGKPEYVFSLASRVGNNQAGDFEAELKKAEPQVRFRLDKNVLHPLGVTLVINGKSYDAIPSAETERSERLIADMGGLGGEMLITSQPDIAIEHADNKELNEQARKVAQLRREKAAKERLEALKAEAARLEGTGLKTYSSDVDSANFKDAERANDYALVIGIESYAQKELPKADYAERDADAVKQYLLALGLPERNIKLLKGSDATYSKLKSYVESWLPKNVKDSSRVFFYFSGHGAPDTKTGSAYILPWDGQPEFLESGAYPLAQLYEHLGRLKAKVLVALDSCFSGAGGRSVLPKGARPLVIGKAAGALPSNITLLSAASGDEITGGLEEQGHGRFTYYMLKGIYSGINDSGKLCDYLRPQVQDAAARQNTVQTPVCRGNTLGQLR